MSQCNACHHWRPLCRRDDEEAPCDLLDRYLKTMPRAASEIFTPRGFGCLYWESQRQLDHLEEEAARWGV